MPELPEVETTRRGLAPHVEGRRIQAVTSSVPSLRTSPVMEPGKIAESPLCRMNSVSAATSSGGTGVPDVPARATVMGTFTLNVRSPDDA